MSTQVAAKTVVFYEKPGCAGNRRQKDLLQEHGIALDVRDMSKGSWTKEKLEAYFGDKPNEAIVNTSSPLIKSGDVDPAALSRDELIEKMLTTPLLIKRPLIEFGDTLLCGFDIPRLNSLLGIQMPVPETINSCLSTDKCSHHAH
ncbi:ArsC/Spx/MgsR family protein [Azomonas macrocytogenes]|uniref:Nitrogenase-associated protein n=1 Tax=Azomonas macrocytogenes TaxID=69962 RepID=A0A839T616_AZOMA|nr:ArsC/Spx/MgsR family protein [Azomonas macrocytogenes]MBB3103123.1 nitrogenase-associated protein [Azomonas macrocytogenes]